MTENRTPIACAAAATAMKSQKRTARTLGALAGAAAFLALGAFGNVAQAAGAGDCGLMMSVEATTFKTGKSEAAKLGIDIGPAMVDGSTGSALFNVEAFILSARTSTDPLTSKSGDGIEAKALENAGTMFAEDTPDAVLITASPLFVEVSNKKGNSPMRGAPTMFASMNEVAA